MTNQMKNTQAVREQYKNAQNLETRISIHEKYSTNSLGFGNWIQEHYQFFEGCNILELGCGNGNVWNKKISDLPASANLVLSDFSEGMVQEVHKKYSHCPNVSFQQIDIENIPYEAETFDFVIANMMLYHVPDISKGISEVCRILKPNSVFYSATYGANGISEWISEQLYREYGILININENFTLQNGAEKLSCFFSHVERHDYFDSLEITDTNDLLDYLFSLTFIMPYISQLNRTALFNLFESYKNPNGTISIPKEYGMFISKK